MKMFSMQIGPISKKISRHIKSIVEIGLHYRIHKFDSGFYLIVRFPDKDEIFTKMREQYINIMWKINSQKSYYDEEDDEDSF